MKCTFNSALRWAALGLLAVTPLWAQAQNAIESINVAQQGTAVILKINMKDAPTAPPAGFAVASPPRIALDFANTINALGRNSQEIGQGDLRSINVVQVGDRSRMVLNLKGAATFDSKVEGKSVLITLTGAAGSSSGAAVRPTHFAEARSGDAKSSLRDVDFRRTADGSGRIIVELAQSNTGVDIRQQGQTLVVEFQKATLPENLRRRLDVADFDPGPDREHLFAGRKRAYGD